VGTSAAEFQVSVLIDGRKLIPAPRVEFARRHERSPDGTSRRSSVSVKITGQILAFAGSPDNTGAFWTGAGYPPDPPAAEWSYEHRMANLREKLRAVENLFAAPAPLLEITPPDGSPPIRCVLRVNQISFGEGPWTNFVPLSVDAETQCVHYGNGESLSCDEDGDGPEPEETWAVEPGDDLNRTWRVTHNASAQAQARYDEATAAWVPGWEIARSYVLGVDDPDRPTARASVLGFKPSRLGMAGALNLTGMAAYNQTRAVQVDEAAGRYAVTETWLGFTSSAAGPSGQAAGKALEELSVEARYGVDGGLTAVTVSGVVAGLDERDDAGVLLVTRQENATLRFAPIYAANATSLRVIAEAHAGRPLNPFPVSTSVGKNAVSGVVQYSVGFDDRPPATDARYLTETYEAAVDWGGAVIATIPVLFRPLGPILQDLDATSPKTLTVTAEIAVAARFGEPEPAKPDYDPTAARVAAIGSPTQLFVVSDRESWRPRQGRYNRSTTFLFQG
jgi:hypothetical protein